MSKPKSVTKVVVFDMDRNQGEPSYAIQAHADGVTAVGAPKSSVHTWGDSLHTCGTRGLAQTSHNKSTLHNIATFPCISTFNKVLLTYGLVWHYIASKHLKTALTTTDTNFCCRRWCDLLWPRWNGSTLRDGCWQHPRWAKVTVKITLDHS